MPDNKHPIRNSLSWLGRQWDILLLIGMTLVVVGMLYYVLLPRPKLVIQLEPVDQAPALEQVAQDNPPHAISRGEPLHKRSHSPHVLRVNPNTATRSELERLPGIGPALAGRIIRFRQQNGDIESVDDLIRVRGIGEKSLAQMRPHLEILRND